MIDPAAFVPPEKDPFFGYTVVDGELQFASASSINLHDTCQTKWWYRYVKRDKSPDDYAGKDFGIAAHARVEHYLKTGEDLLGACERPLLPFLPPARSLVLVEQQMFYPKPLAAGDVAVIGKIDCVDLNRLESDGLVVVNDWKFKKDIKKWATAGEKLADSNDEDGRQMFAGMKWVVDNIPGVKWLLPRHVSANTGGIEYGKPKGPWGATSTQPDSPISLDDVNRAWDHISEEFIEPMKVTAAAAGPEGLRGNKEMCWKYGRPCPYLKQCPHQAGPFGKLKAGEVKMAGLLSRLSKMNGASDVAPPPMASVPMPVASVPAPVVEQPKPAKRRPEDYSEAELLQLRAQNAADRDTDDPALKIPDVTDGMLVVSSLATEQVAEPAPARRGRKPGSKNKPAQPDSPIQETAAVKPPVEVEVAPPSLAVAPRPTYEGVHFYFGCYPCKAQAKTLHAFMETIQGMIFNRFKDRDHFDLRNSEHADLKFGKWKGWLATVAREVQLEPGHYVIGTEDERINIVADAITSRIPSITRGAR
jgi:hypothetical protein